MNNDHLTAPMLSAAMDEVIALRNRVEMLEAALQKIAYQVYGEAEEPLDEAIRIAQTALDGV